MKLIRIRPPNEARCTCGTFGANNGCAYTTASSAQRGTSGTCESPRAFACCAAFWRRCPRGWEFAEEAVASAAVAQRSKQEIEMRGGTWWRRKGTTSNVRVGTAHTHLLRAPGLEVLARGGPPGTQWVCLPGAPRSTHRPRLPCFVDQQQGARWPRVGGAFA